ncbi:DUF4113 domain-containing protein [Gluconobacter oxydans]|nr:DUF4113 domain-containing protein [Gluconobacter oxydans]
MCLKKRRFVNIKRATCKRSWTPRQSLLSARYTTRLDEIVRARSW